MTEQQHPEREHYQRRERRGELPPYLRVARFPGEQPAGQAYDQAQQAIYSGPPNDVSLYRIILNQVYHLTVLGQTPPDQLRQQLETIFSAGEPAELPQDVLKGLAERRRQQIRHGPWVEGHFRPPHRP